ncbi:hypothetical protein [uncultured Microbacterium sp.]|uniref:hypothetical protein n=1 Tax=uncultured Microbacterium sp. TaxID=191216 RepID=UPI0025DC8351|nr:hypothetical protein [uncultured Microbacterium sp.]
MNPRRSALGIPSRGRRRAARAPRAGIASALVVAIGVVAIGLAGCAPGPAPKPTPTPLFTSEADAFKAAEQVYRDYIESVNAHETDPASDPQRYLAGGALEEDISSVRDQELSGKKIVGATEVALYRSESYDSASTTVKSFVCLDVSSSRILDANGNDITPQDRPPVVAVAVSMTLVSAAFKIVGMSASNEPCS